jgi:serine/threonine protein phosphatase 1
MFSKHNMRTLAIGDIHGCHVALMCLLEQIALRANDKIVFLGDYIDRGPASRAVVESMVNWTAKCPAIFLRGNHEVMVLDACEDELKANLWQSYGGFEALISYGAAYDPKWAAKIPRSHWEFLTRTARYWETEKHIFVHACLDPEADMADQPDWLLYWEHVDRLKPHKSGKQIICGHSPQRSGRILDLGFAVCIDTSPADGGWLTCLDVTSGHWWQANENQESRQGSIPVNS